MSYIELRQLFILFVCLYIGHDIDCSELMVGMGIFQSVLKFLIKIPVSKF